MDPTTLAASVTAALVPAMPFLVKGGEKLAVMAAEQLGGAAFDRAKALWEWLRGPLQASPAAAEVLQRQLAALMEQAGYQAGLHGDGAIAQGEGAVAAGKGGIAVGGSVQGDIVTGRKG